MKKSTIGAVLLIVLAAGFFLVWKQLMTVIAKRKQIQTSDAAKATACVRVGADGYLGYWFITSPEMRRQAAAKGLSINLQDDGGDYANRLRKFAAGEYDMIVLPVSSYLEHGAEHKYPGVIVAAVAESKGADGIVGFADKFPTGAISELNDPALKVVYTAKSPSSFLLDLTIVDFDLFNLTASSAWRVEVKGAQEAFDGIRARRGDAFVLWEPELGKALAENKNLKYLWGSDKFGGYIVDVFVFNRNYLRAHEQDALIFLQSYFATLSIYANNRDKLLDEIARSTGLKKETAESMLAKIDFFDLWENCSRQFGIELGGGRTTAEGVVNSIIACVHILIKTGKFAHDPLDGNPYSITYSALLEKLKGSIPSMVGGRKGAEAAFAPLDDAGWVRLREVGTMRVEPITFQTSENMLDEVGKEQVDKIAALLQNNYPNFRIAIRGHTGPGNDEENRQLSLERAQAVAQRLVAVHGVNPNRLRAEGLGSKQPPPRRADESERAYRYRWPRVEFTLLEGNRL